MDVDEIELQKLTELLTKLRAERGIVLPEPDESAGEIVSIGDAVVRAFRSIGLDEVVDFAG